MIKAANLFLFLCFIMIFSSAAWGAGIIATPEHGFTPLVVLFTVDSAEPLTSISWDFNGDGEEDSSEAETNYTFVDVGMHTVTALVASESGEFTLHKNISVDSVGVSINATPKDGAAPLEVQFASTVEGSGLWTYAWDFNGDGTVDSTAQSPTHTFETVGEYISTLVVINNRGQNATAHVTVTVTAGQPNIIINSYFPQNLKLGEQEITFVVKNIGSSPAQEVKVKVVGTGIQHLSSTTIESLAPEEEDSVTARVRIVQEGTLNTTIKVAGKNYPLSFTVAESVKYNQEELQQLLEQLKTQLQEQEAIYADKKAQGFSVSEAYDSIKSIKEQLRGAQEKILTDKLPEAQVSLNLIRSGIEEVTLNLELSKKQKQTILMWMKDNALAITAIVAAIGTLSGIMIKLTHHAKKLGENVKQKMIIKRTITSSTPPGSGTQIVKEVVETSDAKEEEKKEHKESKEDSKS